MSWLKELLFLFLILKLSFCQNFNLNNCGSKQTCSECIQELGCIWCIKPFGNANHCAHKNEAHPNWCSDKYKKQPTSSFNTLEDKPLTNTTGRTIQIRPQRLNLTLRRGEQYAFSFEYAQAANYPVDLYYIMDLSKSMEEHKNKLAALGKDLSQTMTKITSNFQLGFGSFVDKVDLPFVSTVPSKLKSPCNVNDKCVPPYSYKNHMSLSEDYEKFTREVLRANISGNLDAPEGGFDAMMQAIVCKKEIGWRPQARHLLVFSTDAEFHIAGDGKLAGVVEPNTAQCHMKNHEYTHYLKEDYPSVSHINYIAKENNINVIFAIVDKSRIVRSYEELSKHIQNSEVGVLGKKSENVVNLVVENYKKIVGSIKISSNSSNDVDVKIIPNCPSPIESGCKNIHAGDIVKFNATIKPLQCTKDSNKKIIAIKPEGIEDSIIIELNVLCDCDCEHEDSESYEPNSPDCKGSGTLKCGVCDCNPGFFGETCECNKQHSVTNNVTACIAPNDTRVCSGLGVCICGQCRCDVRDNPDEKITGKYCDCDNYSCRKIGGKLCSGRGECTCREKCICQAGWTGDACECPDSESSCIKPDNGLVCNGHGKCNCGKCQCNDEEVRYSGKYCDECPTCSGQRCEELRNCVECRVHKDGAYNETECETNCTFSITTVKKIEDDEDEGTKRCTLVDAQGCTFVFQYEYDGQNELRVVAEEEKFCPAPPNVMAWVLGVILSILFAGLILLLIWKVCTTIHDRREYARFENERQKLRWHRNENPLYKQATSTFSNPVYRKSRSFFKRD